jgi:hypothetical protein
MTNCIAFFCVVGGIVMFQLGVIVGSIKQRQSHPAEPKRDADGKRDPIPAYLQAPPADFEAPILSSMPIHEFKKCSNSPYCEECGAGQYHAVHAHPTEQNQELWKRIQKP